MNQSWPTEARAYCGCCRQEHPAHEVESGICMDCWDECWFGPCVARNATCCDRVYLCDGEVECPVHGGFDVCCDRPDLHRPIGEERTVTSS